MRIYVDTSAILRRVLVSDTHALAVERYLGEHNGKGDTLISSILAVIEVHRALQARRARGGLPPGFDLDAACSAALAGIEVVAITEEVSTLASRLSPDVLRSQDAIHVATAILDHCDTVITYDERQAEAVRLNGMTVVSPNENSNEGTLTDTTMS